MKASIPGAIWATPPAPLPHRVRGHPRLQHRQPKFASSVTRLGESAAIGHSPRGVFFDGTVLPSRTSRNRLPADCRYGVTTGDRARDCPGLMARHRMRPLQFWSMIVGLSLPPTEIITGALIDPILTRWGASERLPRAENQCAVRLQLMSGLVRIADSRQTSREVRKVPQKRPLNRI